MVVNSANWGAIQGCQTLYRPPPRAHCIDADVDAELQLWRKTAFCRSTATYKYYKVINASPVQKPLMFLDLKEQQFCSAGNFPLFANADLISVLERLFSLFVIFKQFLK